MGETRHCHGQPQSSRPVRASDPGALAAGSGDCHGRPGAGGAGRAGRGARAAQLGRLSGGPGAGRGALADTPGRAVRRAAAQRGAARFSSTVGEIFLHEGRIEDAIAVAEGAPYDYTVVERVADVALQSHPDWVIRTCRQQAERIMDAAQSRYYHHAVACLGRARAAALASGRQDEWRQYVDSLLVRHGRKYSLVPQLKQLLA